MTSTPCSFEPLATMAEADARPCSVRRLRSYTGRIVRSLELLVELDRAVRTLDGSMLVEGWQPADLPAVIQRQAELLAARGWPDAFGG